MIEVPVKLGDYYDAVLSVADETKLIAVPCGVEHAAHDPAIGEIDVSQFHTHVFDLTGAELRTEYGIIVTEQDESGEWDEFIRGNVEIPGPTPPDARQGDTDGDQ